MPGEIYEKWRGLRIVLGIISSCTPNSEIEDIVWTSALWDCVVEVVLKLVSGLLQYLATGRATWVHLKASEEWLRGRWYQFYFQLTWYRMDEILSESSNKNIDWSEEVLTHSERDEWERIWQERCPFAMKDANDNKWNICFVSEKTRKYCSPLSVYLCSAVL